MLVMPQGLDLNLVCRNFLFSNIGGVPLAPARDDLLVFTKNILSGVTWMHAQQVMHLDIRLRNMLLLSHGRIVLCDFGCAAHLGSPPSHDKWGTPGFRCPERLPSTAADVWSVGRVLQVMWRADCHLGSSTNLRRLCARRFLAAWSRMLRSDRTFVLFSRTTRCRRWRTAAGSI